jgi:opacity protein-like surface antigen
VVGTPQRPPEVTVSTQSHTSLAKILVGAVLALCIAAPAALADSTAPAFPSAVPSQPGALTGPESASNAARAQESYYSSYGNPAPLSQPSTLADDGGVDWSAIGIAIGGAFLIAGVPMVMLMRTRRRAARVRVVA